MAAVFEKVFRKLQLLQPQEPEPMMNILAYVNERDWNVHIFPRVIHRPRQYFETGNSQILLSPASVDMGGVFITPREEDFNKISADDIRDILSQVCMDEDQVQRLIEFKS
jgi:hypothetical protein